MKHKPGTLRQETSTLRRLFPDLVSVPGVATGTVPGSSLKAGERGCAMAHRELWSTLQHKPGPHLVLEDDAKARSEEGLCGKLQDLQKSMEKEKLDLINIGPCFWDGHRKNGALCTAAYLISQKEPRSSTVTATRLINRSITIRSSCASRDSCGAT